MNILYKSTFLFLLLVSVVCHHTTTASEVYAGRVNNELVSASGGEKSDYANAVQVNGTVTSTNVTGCDVNNNGSISIINPTGGSGLFEYSVNGGISWQTSGTFTSIGAGSYDVRIRDAQDVVNFKVLNSNLIITQPAQLSATVSISNASSCTANDGSITISAPVGGSGSYEYRIDYSNPWVATTNFTGLANGSYDVRIRDAANTSCETWLTNAVVAAPGSISASLNNINVTTCGGSDGSITVTGISGGSGTYEYSKNEGQTWQSNASFTGLSAANYYIIARDKNNTSCIWSSGMTISQPSDLSVTFNSSAATTCSSKDGSITIISSSGGSGAYEYSINFGYSWTSNIIFDDLEGMSYGLQVRDKNNPGCFKIESYSIDLAGPGRIEANYGVGNVTTCGGTDGSIAFFNVSGGSGSYEYSKDGVNWQATNTFTNLSAGGYSIRIRDTNSSCVLENWAYISQPSDLAANYSSSAPTGCNAFDGAIMISNPSGGSGTYEYSLNGGFSWQAGGSFTNLGDGYYSITIRDKNSPSCFKELANNIYLSGPGSVKAHFDVENVTSCGGSDGKISLFDVTGGSGQYEYSINGGDTWQSSQTYAGLQAGYYQLKIRDKNNVSCYLNVGIMVDQPSNLNASYTSSQPTGCSTNDGSILISNPTGGSGAYEYSINHGYSWETSGSYTNISGGFFSIFLRDKNNPSCFNEIANTLDLTGPGSINVNFSVSDVTTCGGNDGMITFSGESGGSGTYEYSIDHGMSWQTSSVFTNLAADGYNMKVRDKNNPGCYWFNGTTVNQPSDLSVSYTSNTPTACAASDGSITFTSPSGGSGVYEYSISNGNDWQGSPAFTNLEGRYYSLAIRDKNNPGCFKYVNYSLNLLGPGSISFNVSRTDASSCGASDGSLTVNNTTGGSGSFEYSKDEGMTWQASATFTGLHEGSYEIRVRDKNNTSCYAVTYQYVNSPSNLNASYTTVNTSACGVNDGKITIENPSGGSGTGAYEYSIDGGITWQDNGSYAGLKAESYDVRIRDKNNTSCYRVLHDEVRIEMPVKLEADVSAINITACGSNDGQIIISNPSGGSGEYEYSINGGASWTVSGTFSNLLPGSYNAAMRDKNAPLCKAGGTLTLTAPGQITATVASSQVTTCYGNNNGSITISNPSGGGGIYQYSINGGATWQTSGSYPNISGGTYDIRIRDAASTSCIFILASGLSISQPSQLTAIVSKTDILCNGASTGAIVISGAAGGSGSFEYSKNGGSNWQSGTSFMSLTAGTYNVKIRDAAQPTCTIALNASLSITQPAVLAATVTPKNISCNGANDGAITFSSISGGAGTYQFTKNGGTSWESVTSYSSLSPATYNVKIRDAATTSCVVTLNGALAISQPSALAATFTKTNATSCLNNDGKITITGATGGYGTYEFSKDNGATWQSSGSYTGLPAASYTAKLRDAANTGCMIQNTLTITKPADVSASVSSVNVSVCYGNTNGSITLTSPVGGSGAYQYSVDGGLNWQSSASFSGLSAKSYDVRVRDANSTTCTATINTNLIITQPAQLSATVAKTDVVCNGASTGGITISGSTGGSGSFEYSKNGGANWQSGNSFTSLSAGTYSVQMRDAANTSCVLPLNTTLAITQPAVLNASITAKNISCNNASDGAITFSSISGGAGTYQFTKNGGTSWENVTGYTLLAPATYDVKIRDAVNTSCVVTLNSALVITQPAALAATFSRTNATSCLNNDGTITISGVSGGYGTYEFSKDNGASWQGSGSFTGLASGSYTAKMRDAANTSCTITGTLTITKPADVSASITHSDVTCYGVNNGSITFTTPVGGSGSYEYTIDGGVNWQSGTTFSGLIPKSYDARVRDANSVTCTAIVNNAITVDEPELLTATSSTVDVTCNGSSDGSIKISGAAGGTGTYEYSKDGGTNWQTSDVFNNLTAGTYDIKMRDALHGTCVVTLNDNMNVAQPAVLAATISTKNVTCHSGNDGEITFSNISGGAGTYEFSKNGGTSWENVTSFVALSSATYNVKIRDAVHTNCIVTLNGALMLTQPAALTATVASANATSCANNDGTINITAASGGSGLFEYSINGGATWSSSENFSQLSSGNYNVFVRDLANKSCVLPKSIVTITAPDQLTATLNATDVSLCFGLSNGSIEITGASGGSNSFEYSRNGGATWQATGTFSDLPEGTYDVRMRDMNSTTCVTILNSGLKIDQPGKLKAVVASTKTACKSNTGSINVTNAEGGSGNYEYSFNGGTTWSPNTTIGGLAVGQYEVHMRDGASTTCVEELNNNVEIVPVIVLNASSVATDVSCNNGNNGSIVVTAAGGTGQYDYSADGGTTWSDNNTFDNLIAQEYTLIVRDQSDNTCDFMFTETIAEPAALSIETFRDNVNSVIEVVGSGGTTPYVYQLNEENFVSSGVFTNLTRGMAHTFTVKDANQCTVSKLDSIDLITALEEFETISSIQLYPIPARDYVEVTINHLQAKSCEVSLVNTWGVSVYHSNVPVEDNKLHHVLDVSSSAKGVYTVLVKVKDKVYMKKMILQ